MHTVAHPSNRQGSTLLLQLVERESDELKTLTRQLHSMVASIRTDLLTAHGDVDSTVTKPDGDPPARSRACPQLQDSEPPDDFDEDLYLHYHPDVASAVSAGHMHSGYEHWRTYGKAEGRIGGPQLKLPDREAFHELLATRPFGVNLFGYLSAPSGLGTAARGLLSALRSAGVPVNAIPLRPWQTTEEEREPLPVYNPYRINLFLLTADIMPLFVKAYGTGVLSGCYNIGYWLWELPSVRADWFAFQEYVDEIWVASTFCKLAFESSIALPVRRIPLVVDRLEEKAVFGRDHFGLPRDTFVFGYVFDVSSYMERKNPTALVKAFRAAFEDCGDVLLLLKYTNAGADAESLRRLGAAIGGSRSIRVISTSLTEEENTSLHTAIDCLVSPHRSEGFGFNLVEAMYFGKAVVATGYSANVDYMHEGNSYLVNYALTPIEHTVGPYQRGALWAAPSAEHLAERMREVYENPTERAKRGHRAAMEVRAWFGPDTVGSQMMERFAELGLTGGPLEKERLWTKRHNKTPKLFPSDAPEEVRKNIRGWAHKPVISIVTPVYNISGEYLRECIESVRAQWYPFWELCLCDDASTDEETLQVLEHYRGTDPRIRIVRSERNCGIATASNRCAERSTGEYLAMLDNDDTITSNALYEIARVLNEKPETDLLYSDEDKIDITGAYCDHFFKPDYSPEHLRSVMYILHMLVVRKTLFYQLGGFRDEFSGAQDYDLALRVSEVSRRIQHVPKVLYHWRKLTGSAAEQVDAKPKALDASRRALEDHVLRCDLGWVENGCLTGTYRVHYAVGSPKVSLLILSSDPVVDIEGRGSVHLLEHLVKSIVEKTNYRNYEIVIVDDGNLSVRTRRGLSGIPYRVASYVRQGIGFNFADKANFAFSQARTEHMVLLNDDMEIISPGWLVALLEPLAIREVGVVGARLIFANGELQHAGMVIGVNDGAAHIYHHSPQEFIGYNGFTHVIRNYCCVTAACMATRADVVRATGPWDTGFIVDYNDVDFCLRVLECGYRVVYTPYAELYHFEGSTCIRRSANLADVERFQTKWQKYIMRDPYYNPNLTKHGLEFAADPAAWGSNLNPQVSILV